MGSPLTPGWRSHTVRRAPRLAQPGHHGGIGVGRNEDVERPAGGAGDHRRGEGRVAAARDREWGRGRGRPSARTAHGLGDLELQQRAHEVTSLVRARHVPGLVLDPDTAGRREAEAIAQLGGAGERRDAEAAPVDCRNGRIQALDEGHVLRVAPTQLARRVPGVKEGPVADEGVGLVSLREGEPCRIELPGQNVVDIVVSRRGGAAQWNRLARRDAPAAPRALEPGTGPAGRAVRRIGRSMGGHEAARVRALNSPMS